jgi:ectoine hydroxylase-related dioxygenase (phytanoyl-CoA dioxygenase family)
MTTGKEAAMIESAAVSGIEEALRQRGVTEGTISTTEENAIDQQGYLVLPEVLPRPLLAQLRAAFDLALDQGRRSGIGCELDSYDPVYDGISTHPKVLAAVYHVLRRPFVATGLRGRDPLPGFGQQGLHTDSAPLGPSQPFFLVTALWLLDDFTPTNGATRVVPGSHGMRRPLPKPLQQPESHHPREKVVVAEAGSVLLFHGHLWHGGTRNRGGARRRVLQGQFLARDRLPPATAPAEVPERFPPAVRYFLGA